MHILRMMVDFLVLSHVVFTTDRELFVLCSACINMIMYPLTILDLDGCHLSLLFSIDRYWQCTNSLLGIAVSYWTHQYSLVLSINIILEYHLVLLVFVVIDYLALYQKSFKGKATMWWNSLPVNFTRCTPGDFMDSLFSFLIAAWLNNFCVISCNMFVL